MPGAAHHAMRLAAGFPNRLLDCHDEKRIHRHRLLTQESIRITDNPRRFAISSAARIRSSTAAGSNLVQPVTNIESQPRLPRNDVSGARFGLD